MKGTSEGDGLKSVPGCISSVFNSCIRPAFEGRTSSPSPFSVRHSGECRNPALYCVASGYRRRRGWKYTSRKTNPLKLSSSPALQISPASGYAPGVCDRYSSGGTGSYFPRHRYFWRSACWISLVPGAPALRFLSYS